MRSLVIILCIVAFVGITNAHGGTTSTYRCQNSQLVQVGDSAVIVESKCGQPLSKEVINTGQGNSGQTVTEWYYPMKSGWFGVLTIRAGKVTKISEMKK